MDAPCDALQIECRQIFERTAAAGEDEHVRRMPHPLGAVEGGEDLAFRLRPLHGDVEAGHAQAGKAPPQHRQHVAQGGAVAGTDHRQMARKLRQRPLAFRREQALGAEPGAQLFEGDAQRTLAGAFDVIDEGLEVAPGFVHGEASPQHHG